jgi:hypothetical protein
MPVMITPSLLRQLEQLQLLARRKSRSSAKGERRSRARASLSAQRINLNSRGRQPTVKAHRECDPERVEPTAALHRSAPSGLKPICHRYRGLHPRLFTLFAFGERARRVQRGVLVSPLRAGGYPACCAFAFALPVVSLVETA